MRLLALGHDILFCRRTLDQYVKFLAHGNVILIALLAFMGTSVETFCALDNAASSSPVLGETTGVADLRMRRGL